MFGFPSSGDITDHGTEHLERYAREWRAYAFSTERANRPVTEGAIADAYTQAGLLPPRIVWCSSPIFLLFAHHIATGIHDLYKHGGILAWEREFSVKLRDIDVGGTVKHLIFDNLMATLMRDVPQITGGMPPAYRQWGEDQLFLHPQHQHIAQTIAPFANTLRHCSSMLYFVFRSVANENAPSHMCLGQLDSARMAVYQYLFEVVGIAPLAPLQPLWTISQNASWWLPCEHICFISERPTVQLFDADGRLHAELGAAMQFEDGYSLYAWHGMSIHEDVILHPERITVEQIESERNTEIRRVLIERFGIGEYLEASGFDVMSTDEYGVLVRKEQRGDEPIVMVKVFNSTPELDGSTKVYWLPVPPRYVHHNIQDEAGVLRALGGWGNRDWNSPREAIGWTFGLSETEYNPSQET